MAQHSQLSNLHWTGKRFSTEPGELLSPRLTVDQKESEGSAAVGAVASIILSTGLGKRDMEPIPTLSEGP